MRLTQEECLLAAEALGARAATVMRRRPQEAVLNALANKLRAMAQEKEFEPLEIEPPENGTPDPSAICLLARDCVVVIGGWEQPGVEADR